MSVMMLMLILLMLMPMLMSMYVPLLAQARPHAPYPCPSWGKTVQGSTSATTRSSSWDSDSCAASSQPTSPSTPQLHSVPPKLVSAA